MQKTISCILLYALSWAVAIGQNDAAREKFTPFYTRDAAPLLEKIIPAPPSLSDPLFFNDWAQYQWGLSQRETERGRQAVIDARIGAAYFMKRFSPVVGKELTPEGYPELYRLFKRLHLTEQEAGYSAKKFFHRVRPYQQYHEPSGVPSHERATDFTSYPSGHTHCAWLIGLTMASIAPEHTEEILNIAYEIGQSRVIVGFHYQSDVDMGRIAGSVTYARVNAEPEFRKQMDKVRREYARH